MRVNINKQTGNARLLAGDTAEVLSRCWRWHLVHVSENVVLATEVSEI